MSLRGLTPPQSADFEIISSDTGSMPKSRFLYIACSSSAVIPAYASVIAGDE